MAYEIRELDIGGVLDDALRLFRDRIGFVTLATGLFVFPIHFLLGFLSEFVLLDPLDAGQGVMRGPELMDFVVDLWLKYIPILVGLEFASGLVLAYPEAVLVRGMGRQYLGKAEPARASFLGGLRLWWRMLVLRFLTSLIVFVAFLTGSCLLGLPGLAAAALLMPCPAVLVLENTGILRSMARSVELAWGLFPQAFLLLLALDILGAGLDIAASFLAPSYYLSLVLSAAVTASSDVLVLLARVTFYFSARCRLEHLDLDLLADAVDAPPPLPEAAL